MRDERDTHFSLHVEVFPPSLGGRLVLQTYNKIQNMERKE